MCGIAGFLERTPSREQEDRAAIAERMAGVLQHRGPDDAGTWVDPEAGVAFGHQRLSILDLSREGRQPMHSACRRYVLAYNGEVYDFRHLRQSLRGLGHTFRSESDTEVILASFTQWGIEDSLHRFNGMFAMAVWDRHDRSLTLVRDRMGQKPLYYGWSGNTLLFGSELKALRAFPGFDPAIDRDALTLLLRRGCIAAPYTIYESVSKLEPGHLVRVTPGAGPTNLAPRTYWSLRDVLERGARNPFTGSRDEAVDALDELLRDAVRLCMVSDVPLGAFLSGGIDSSTIVAMMQAQSDRPVRTFSIGFHEDSYNEAHHAARVAEQLGTDHTELYVTEQDALELIPELPRIYDEPFADASQIPTCLLSRLTREHVTVSLSGDGGDELFAGYDKYRYFDRLTRLTRLPDRLRRAGATVLRAISGAMPGPVPSATPARLARLLEAASSADELYVHVASIWKDPSRLVPDSDEPSSTLTARGWPTLQEPLRRAMAVDALTYLPDDVLVKVDRAAMHVGLETRIPLLDHRVVEFAGRLPLHLIYRNGRGKIPLRQVLDRYVSRDLLERPKMGFDIPLATWLRNELRPWVEDLLDDRRLGEEALFDAIPIRLRWEEHLRRDVDWSGYLWPVLMFQAWHDQWHR